jgi:hypothetical protein
MALMLRSGEERGTAFYDVTSGKLRQLSDDAGGNEIAWMPRYTRVAYFTTAGKLMIEDIGSLKRHEIAVNLPVPPDRERSIAASPDGRTLYYGARQVEATIWKLERPRAAKP